MSNTSLLPTITRRTQLAPKIFLLLAITLFLNIMPYCHFVWEITGFLPTCLRSSPEWIGLLSLEGYTLLGLILVTIAFLSVLITKKGIGLALTGLLLAIVPYVNPLIVGVGFLLVGNWDREYVVVLIGLSLFLLLVFITKKARQIIVGKKQ